MYTLFKLDSNFCTAPSSTISQKSVQKTATLVETQQNFTYRRACVDRNSTSWTQGRGHRRSGSGDAVKGSAPVLGRRDLGLFCCASLHFTRGEGGTGYWDTGKWNACLHKRKEQSSCWGWCRLGRRKAASRSKNNCIV